MMILTMVQKNGINSGNEIFFHHKNEGKVQYDPLYKASLKKIMPHQIFQIHVLYLVFDLRSARTTTPHNTAGGGGRATIVRGCNL